MLSIIEIFTLFRFDTTKMRRFQARKRWYKAITKVTTDHCDQVVSSVSHTNQSQVVLLVKVKDQLVLPSLIQVEQVHY